MNKKTLSITISAMGIGLNIVLAVLAKTFVIPFLFFDTIGTILAGVLLGPFFGGITGLITNVLTSIVNNPVELPYAIVNMVIGIFVGCIARKYVFNVKTAIITGLILSVLAPLIGTPITVYLFGGLAGGTLDIFVGWLAKSGQKIFTAAFIPRVLSNVIDKSVSCVIVALIIQKLPQNIKRELNINE